MEIKDIADYCIKRHSKGNVIVEEDRVLVAHIGRYLPNIYRVMDKENTKSDKYIAYSYAKANNDTNIVKCIKETNYVVGKFWREEHRKLFRQITDIEFNNCSNDEQHDLDCIINTSYQNFIDVFSPVLDDDMIIYYKEGKKKNKIKNIWFVIKYRYLLRIVSYLLNKKIAIYYKNDEIKKG